MSGNDCYGVSLALSDYPLSGKCIDSLMKLSLLCVKVYSQWQNRSTFPCHNFNPQEHKFLRCCMTVQRNDAYQWWSVCSLCSTTVSRQHVYIALKLLPNLCQLLSTPGCCWIQVFCGERRQIRINPI